MSVIIPTYNRARQLRRCLEGLAKQTFQNFEVIVVDDGSTDDSGNVAQEYAQILNLKYIYQSNSGGPARPRNMALRAAKGELIAFLDSDDWWLSSKLEEAVPEFKKGADVVYHDLYSVKRERRPIFPLRTGIVRQLRSPVFDDLIINGNAIPNSSAMVRAELLRSIGGISEDPELVAAEDFDCWIRLSMITERFMWVRRVLGFYWIGEGNISTISRMVRNGRRLRQLYIDKFVRERNIEIPWWISYTEGRNSFIMGSDSESRAILRKILTAKAPMLIRLKALWMLSALPGARYRRKALS